MTPQIQTGWIGVEGGCHGLLSSATPAMGDAHRLRVVGHEEIWRPHGHKAEGCTRAAVRPQEGTGPGPLCVGLTRGDGVRLQAAAWNSHHMREEKQCANGRHHWKSRLCISHSCGYDLCLDPTLNRTSGAYSLP